MPNGEGLPPEIIDAIAVSNAKSIGEQPAILANLALANQIANTNLSQQNAISNQQAMFQLQMATLSKCVEVILGTDASSSKAVQQMKEFQAFFSQIMAQLSAVANGTQKPAPNGGTRNGGSKSRAKKSTRRR
ncbi:MAG TPA: RebB family R body protein [Pyrinomonadaceae bacterium]|nr:RebB family R body protein [Pyrinomonadaceae bacterium]